MGDMAVAVKNLEIGPGCKESGIARSLRRAKLPLTVITILPKNMSRSDPPSPPPNPPPSPSRTIFLYDERRA